MSQSILKHETRKITTGDNVTGLWRPSFTKVGGALYVFGGGGMVTNNLTTFQLDTCQWSTVKDIQGTPPSKRYGHSALYYNGNIIIFGGINEFQEYCNDVIVYNIESKTWSHPVIKGKGVPARYFHTANLYQDKMYVYGGFSRNSECTYVIAKLNVLDLKEYTWSTPISIPSRYNHSATLIDSSLYIFAGKDEIGSTVSDLISLDLASPTLKVTKLNVTGCTVLLKSQHFAEALEHNLIVFGKVMEDSPSNTSFGLWRLDLRSLSWTRLDCRKSFHQGVWNYFTILSSNPQSSVRKELLTPKVTPQALLSDTTHLVFLGNEDVDRPQPYDHFRDLITLDAECLGLWRPHQPTLALDLANILRRQDTTDFTLVANDDQKVQVHYIILLARWPYFTNLMDSEMQEVSQRTMTINGSLSAVQELVQFIYTDVIADHLDWELVGELLILASFYILPRLRKICCQRLHHSLSIPTACQIFHFANRAGEKALEAVAIHFILEHFGEVNHVTDLTTLPPEDLKTIFNFIPRHAQLLHQGGPPSSATSASSL